MTATATDAATPGAAAAPVRVVWSTEMLGYDFGVGHPMTSDRIDLTIALAAGLGLLDEPGVEVVDAQPASDALLATVHDPAYVAAVHAAAERGVADPDRGLGTRDDPLFPQMHEAAARVVAGSVDAALAIWAGQAPHAVNVGGGLHHAMPGAASGFCVYNDAAVAIRALLAAGVSRVAYVDIDAHHGDGVQAVFWDDPRVMTVSLHETGAALFPGTGHPRETGGPGADGTAVNVALPSRTGDAGWLRAFDAVVPAVLRAFEPQVLVTQHGCDTHRMDPLASLRVSVDAQRLAAERLHVLAHELCDGRWLALGGGGYAVLDVVPRAWAHLIGIATHRPVAPATPVPDAWLDAVRQRYGRTAVPVMTDGAVVEARPWSAGYDPADDVDRAVRATRAAVFPSLGLDPELD
ncbi:acetoin utilization protein AcuC [Cellulomonas shaoxiangyii]|uniref:Acetoin utilization protein AcuC n=1 Tax=Cellulomonas shaoxiangyii TaxID=2566013 RepID=A0A4P7SGL9_9CELL|nr:acetoin utilization protein AcuC [Cellulomonas shaoxiangyii]QCB92821.1 acetoin utilization protein AcuC [Cellulomonas shaoxiangyii]TGY85533.1 acetoin utilization protein AcuC [Cellulomonas shaoxiangyii]